MYEELLPKICSFMMIRGVIYARMLNMYQTNFLSNPRYNKSFYSDEKEIKMHNVHYYVFGRGLIC